MVGSSFSFISLSDELQRKLDARVAIVVGPPVYVGKGLNAEGLSALQLEMERNLESLYREARSLIR